MKKQVIILFFYIIGINIQGQNNNYSYYSGSDDDGFSQKVKLTLNSDKSFSYKFVDDQVCYENISVSFGEWEQKGDSIKLKVTESLKPKIQFKEKVIKKNTVTIFFNRANEKILFNEKEYYYDSGKPEFNGERNIFFYDRENNKVDIPYNYSGTLEIPISKGVKRIEIYLHNTEYKDNYLEFNIPENTGQILINNLSRYLITDFERYSFVSKKNDIIMKYPWGTYKLESKK